MKTATPAADGQHEGEIMLLPFWQTPVCLLYFLVPLELLMLLVLPIIVIRCTQVFLYVTAFNLLLLYYPSVRRKEAGMVEF